MVPSAQVPQVPQVQPQGAPSWGSMGEEYTWDDFFTQGARPLGNLCQDSSQIAFLAPCVFDTALESGLAGKGSLKRPVPVARISRFLCRSLVM